MGSIVKVIQLCWYTARIKICCKTHRISEEQAKKIVDRKIESKKKRAAKKIVNLKRKRAIIAVSLVIGAMISIFLYIMGAVIKQSASIQTTAVATAIINSQAQMSESGEYELYSGETICNELGQGYIDITSENLANYGIEYDGTFALDIEIEPYQTTGFTQEELQKTIMTIRQGNFGENAESGVIAEDNMITDSVATDIINWATGSLDRNGTEYKVLDTLEIPFDTGEEVEETQRIVLRSTFSEVETSGMVITGFNWVITSIKLVDIEKNRLWKFKEGTYTQDITEEGTAGEIGKTVPTSQKMQNWYYLIKDIDEKCNSIDSELCAPYVVLGTILRESGNTLVVEMSSDDFQYNARLSNSYTNGANTESGNVIGSSNNGYGQFNKTTWDAMRSIKGSTEVGTALAFDSNVGFYRPNCWYLPDQMWTTTGYEYSVLTRSSVQALISRDDFKALDTRDKEFIVGFLCEVAHNRGGAKVDEHIDHAGELITLAQNKSNYGMSSLFDMAEKANVVVWDSETEKKYNMALGSRSTSDNTKSSYDSVFGLNWVMSSNSRYPYLEYAYIDALCGGYQLYIDMLYKIEAETGEITTVGGSGTKGSEIVAMCSEVAGVWQSYGFLYSQTKYEDTAEYGKVRPDCSGYVSTVLWKLGYADARNKFTSRALYKNPLGWEEYTSLSDLQPGDIYVYNGHVQIFAGYSESGQRLWYSWGSDTAARTPQPYAGADSMAVENIGRAKILRVPQ